MIYNTNNTQRCLRLSESALCQIALSSVSSVKDHLCHHTRCGAGGHNECPNNARCRDCFGSPSSADRAIYSLRYGLFLNVINYVSMSSSVNVISRAALWTGGNHNENPGTWTLTQRRMELKRWMCQGITPVQLLL